MSSVDRRRSAILLNEIALCLLFLAGCVGNVPVRADLWSDLGMRVAGVPNPLERTPVTYLRTGVEKYDRFFEDSANIYAKVVISEGLLRALPAIAKKYAQSYAADGAMSKNLQVFLNAKGVTRVADLPDESAFTALLMVSKHIGLREEEVTFAIQATAALAHATQSLHDAALTAGELTERGKALVRTVREDFSGIQALKLGTVGPGLTRSLENVGLALKRAESLSKSVVSLAVVVRSLTAATAQPSALAQGGGPFPNPLAVLPFDNRQNRTPLSLQDLVMTTLVNSGTCKVVERGKLENVLNEQKLQKLRAFDQKTAVETGRLLGAHALLVGTLSTLNQEEHDRFGFIQLVTTARLDAHVVDASTGIVLHATEATGQVKATLVRAPDGTLISGPKNPAAEYPKVIQAAALALGEKLGASCRSTAMQHQRGRVAR